MPVPSQTTLAEAPSRAAGVRVRPWRWKLVIFAAVAAAAFLAVLYDRNNRPPVVPVVTWMSPENNSFPVLMDAAEKLRSLKARAPLHIATASDAEIDAYARAAEPALDQARDALGQPFEALPEVARKSGQPYLTGLESLVRAFRIQAESLLREQRYSRGMESMLDGLELAVNAPKGGGLEAALAGARMEEIALAGAEDTLPRLIWPSLRKTVKRLGEIQELRPPLSSIAEYDALWTRVTYASFFQDAGNCGPAGLEKLWKRDPGLGLIGGVRYAFANKSQMIERNTAYLQSVALEADKPFYQRRRIQPPDNPIALRLGDYAQAGRALTARASIISLLQLEAALELYHLQEDTFPRNLKALAPEYVPRLPTDPFTGKPFHYQRLTSQRYLLSSPGPNRQSSTTPPKALTSGFLTSHIASDK